MTPSTQTLGQRVLDFHLIEIDSVTSASDGEGGDIPSTKSMFDDVASLCSSYGTKNGLNHVLDGNLTTTLTDDLNSRTVVPFEYDVLHHETDDFITKNHGHSQTVPISRSAGDDQADDVLVDVVSGTSGDLSSIHRSLCQNAQGNYDLDDSTPVEPFVQELVQWKKARARPKKYDQGGSGQFNPINNKRKRTPSVPRSKKQKTCLVEKLGANTEGSFGVSRCVIVPSIVEERCVHRVPELPNKNTVSSIQNKPSELRQFRNRLPVELSFNSLITLDKDMENVATSHPKVGTKSLPMANHEANTPVRQTDAFASTPNPVILSQLTTFHQKRESVASADGSFKVAANCIIDIPKARESSLISAGAQKAMSQGSEAAWPNVVSFDNAIEVVDLELEDSDVDEGEELLLADTDADLASAVQFVELRPDDVLRDNGTCVAGVESPGVEQIMAGGTDGTHWSDEVFVGDRCHLTALGKQAGDGDGGPKIKGGELRGFDGGIKARKGLTRGKNARKPSLLSQNSAACKKWVRRRSVIKYHATAPTLKMLTREELDNHFKVNHLHANRVEESRLKWQKLLHGNNFDERETRVVSLVKQFQDGRLSRTSDTLLMEGQQDGNSPAVQCKILPLEHCKELSSNSAIHLVKRGKHWFKKILPPLAKAVNELEHSNEDGLDNCGTDSLSPSQSVSQSGELCPNLALEPLPSSGYIRFVAEPTMPSHEDSPTCTADDPASREDPGLSGSSLHGAAKGSSSHLSSFIIPQNHPEVQFVAMEDITELGDDNCIDAMSLTDDRDPLGGEAEDPFSGLRTVDACQVSDDAVGSDGSLQEQTLLKFEPREDFSDSGLGNSVDSNSFSQGVMLIKFEYNERSSSVNRNARLDESSTSNSSISGSLSKETDIPFGGAKILCLPPPSEKVELPPPPGVSVRQYNLTSDAIHFHQSKQMILDPMMVHRIQGGDSRLPGVCDAEDFILRNFSSNNYVFCEVDPNTSHLPQGLHRFSLQVKGNRVYRSSKPRLTFRIQDSSCDVAASGPSNEAAAAAGNSGTSSTDTVLPKHSDGLTDNESTSSYPRLSSSNSLVMRNPHADLRRYLLVNERLQKLFTGLQQIQQTEKAARLAAPTSLNGAPCPANAEMLQELYSKRVHMQVHFHRVLHYLKVTWFREKIREANCRAAVNNSSTSSHPS